jgi:hypothetical protein
MKRTLTHLGVLDAPPPGSNTGTVDVGGTVEPPATPNSPPPTGGEDQGATKQAATQEAAAVKRASAKIKSSRNLKVDRKGRVTVRVNCSGDAGAVCRGTVKVVRGKATYGAKQFAVKAGKTATVKVKLRKSAKAALKKAGKKAVKSTVVITGKNSEGARISARQAVRLK